MVILSGEPWHKSIAEIRQLDDWQIRNLLCRKYDDKGRLEPSVNNEVDYKEAFFLTWEKRGFTRRQIGKMWRKRAEQYPQDGRAD